MRLSTKLAANNFTSSRITSAFFGIAVAMLGLVACVPENILEPTATAIRSTEAQVSPGIYRIGPDRSYWVTGTADEIVIGASEIARSHPFSLENQSISFDPSIDPVVSADGEVVALPFRSIEGSGGVALVRTDEYKMAVLMYGGKNSFLSSITFLPEYGLTALTLREDSGDRLVAFNNYGMKQFDVPVTNASGELRYSTSEPGYMVLDRRLIIKELELVSLERPENSVVVTQNSITSDGEDLYDTLVATIDSWG